jgi:acetyl-CoA synthetase
VSELLRARDLLLDCYGDRARAEREFRWPDVGDRFCWATDWFDVMARGNNKAGLVLVDHEGTARTWSFDDLSRRSDQVAQLLESRGVGHGGKVLVMLGNQVELWETALAVMKLGAALLPTTAALGAEDLQDRVTRGEVTHVVVRAEECFKFDAVSGDYGRTSVGGVVPGWGNYRDGDDLQASPRSTVTAATDASLLYFTSGTTSKPKMVEHDQLGYGVGHLTTMYWIGLRPGDRHLNLSSPGWAKHAWSCLFAPWLAEAAVVVHDYARFDPAVLLRILAEQQVTTFCAPPTVWRMLIQTDLGQRPGALREVLAAGEPLNPEVIQQVRDAWGLTVRDGFGQTESSLQVGNVPGEQVVLGSMGTAMPGMPVVLVDPVTGEQAEEGEICLDLTHRPPGLMVGYRGDDERTGEAFASGYYHTGDVAQRLESGHLVYVGRTDDVFKASDYKVSPFELESVLLEHPAVAEAAVVPAPDPTRLAVPKAYVALAAGWAPDEQTALAILAHARERLAPYLRVRRVEFFELPKTVSGKIRRVELREREERAHRGELQLTEFRDDVLRG